MYAATIWRYPSVALVRILEMIQNKALSMIFDARLVRIADRRSPFISALLLETSTDVLFVLNMAIKCFDR